MRSKKTKAAQMAFLIFTQKFRRKKRPWLRNLRLKERRLMLRSRAAVAIRREMEARKKADGKIVE